MEIHQDLIIMFTRSTPLVQATWMRSYQLSKTVLLLSGIKILMPGIKFDLA
jgi:hypothetical protein